MKKIRFLIAARWPVLAAVIFCCAGLGRPPALWAAEARPVQLGVLANRGLAECQQQWQATAAYLTRSIPVHTFSLQCLDFAGMQTAVARRDLDFLITNPAQYVQLEQRHGITRILTLLNQQSGTPENRFGGVLFTRAEQSAVTSLAATKGLRLAAPDPASLGGYLAQQRHLRQAGIEIDKHFASVIFTGSHVAAVEAVLTGRAEVGAVRTDLLESMAARGALTLSQLRVLDQQPGSDGFPFVHTTQLYPEWPLARAEATDEELARQLVEALLALASLPESVRMPRWGVPLDYRLVHDCLRELAVAPYEPAGAGETLAVLAGNYLKISIGLVFSGLCGLALLVYFTALNRRLQAAVADREKELAERLKAEQEKEGLIQQLSDSEQRFRSLFNAMNDAVLVHPLCEEGFAAFIEVNQASCQLFGYCRDELLKRTAADLLDAEEALHFGSREFRQELAEQGAIHYEAVVLHKDGTPIQTEISSKVVALQGERVIITIIRDIRRRRKTEADLRRLATAIEQASETVIITDAQGTIQYVNPAFTDNTGYLAEEAIGRNPRILKSGRHDQLFYKRMWHQLKRGETWRGTLINCHKDGSLLQEHATISPVKNSKGVVIHYVAVKRDISRELYLEKQLQQAAKMEAVGTLAGGIAHDFNNILAVILGSSQLAQRMLEAGHPVQDELRQILNSGQRAAELVRQILAFSRHGSDEQKPVQIQFVIKEALKLLRATLPANIRIDTNIDTACPPVLADAASIHQMLMNLCTASRHAMGRNGGLLSVSLTQAVLEQRDENGTEALPAGIYAHLQVRDSGPDGLGEEPGRGQPVSAPAAASKTPLENSGLGMAIVTNIVEVHQGGLRIQDTPEGGCQVDIYLPVIAVEEELPPRHEEVVAAAGSEHILLVDDEPAICFILRRWLEIYGFTVTVCNDGQEALDIYRQAPERYQLMVTDMTMPRLTGLQLAEEILASNPDMPIILCTGYSDFADEKAAKELGVRDFLLKPVDARVMVQTIRRALGKAT